MIFTLKKLKYICQKGSKLENVYLDNIYYNDLKLTKNDITSSEVVSIYHYDSS